MNALLERINDYKMLRENIQNRNLKMVKHFIEKYPKERNAFNNKKESAVALAVKSNSFEVYEILIANGFRLGAHEDLNKILVDDDDDDDEPPTKKRTTIFDIHKRYAIESKHKHNHLMVLRSKCRLIHSTPEIKQQEFYEKVMNSLEELNEIESINLLMKVAACSDELNFIFDFSKDSVDRIDPNKSDKVHGVTYTDSCITIGAKRLLQGEKRSEVNGTLAHEICHFAMRLIYGNKCKPFAKNNKIKQQEFDKILQSCKEKRFKNEIIFLAFNGDEKIWHAELIVRVPHLLALYKENPEKLKEVQEQFKELFEFYDTNVLPDLVRSLPAIEEKFKVKEINEISGVLLNLECSELLVTTQSLQALNIELEPKTKVQILLSNCTKLTMVSVFQKLKFHEKLSSAIFVKLEIFKNAKIVGLIAKTFTASIKPKLIINCKTENFQDIIEVANKLKSKGIIQNIVFVIKKELKVDSLSFDEINETHVEHSWSHLAMNTQDNLLQTQANFQGLDISLSKVVDETMNAIPLNDLVMAKKIIIGKENKFEEVKIYVERKLLKSNAKWMYENQVYDIDPLTIEDIVEEQKVILLADQPGNGKSTEFKMIAKKMKKKFPLRWVEYIDLKQFTKSFQKDGKVSIKFDESQEIAKFLAEEMLKLTGFEAEIFKQLFYENRVILLFDAVDEISPSFQEFVIKLMTAIKEKSMNQLFIATRPHLVCDLEEKLNTKAFKIMPMTGEDARNIFLKFFERKKVSSEKVKEIMIKIEKFLEGLERSFWKESTSLTISSPMVMQMIAKLFDDDLNFNLEDSNLFKIYEKFVKNIVENSMLKGGEARKDSADLVYQSVNIIECHQKKACDTLVDYIVFETDEHKPVKNLCFENTPNIPVDQLVRIGLMYDDGTGTIHFLHRTYAEFLVAHFIFEKIFKQKFQSENDLEAATKFWVKVMNVGNGIMVRKFLDSAIENFEFLKDSEKSKDAMSYIERLCVENNDVLWSSAVNGCMNLIKFVSLELVKDKEKLHQIWIGKVTLTYKSVIFAASHLQPFKFLQKVWSLALEIFNDEQLKELLMIQTQNGENILHSALHNKFDEKPFVFLLGKLRDKLSEDEVQIYLRPKFPFGCISMNIQFTLSRCQKVLDENTFNFFLKSLSSDGRTFLHRVCQIGYNEDLKKILNELFKRLEVNEAEEILWRKAEKSDGNPAIDGIGESALMIAAGSKDNLLETFWSFIESRFNIEKQKEILTEEDNGGRTVFNYAASNVNKENFEFVRNLYKEKFGIEKIKEITGKTNKHGENCLFLALERGDQNQESVGIVWNDMQTFFDDKTLKDIFLKMLVKRYEKRNFFDYCEQSFLHIFMPFIIKTCTNNESHETFQIWLFTARFCRIESIQELGLNVDHKGKFAASFYQKLFRFQDEKNENILQYAQENQENPEVLRFLKNKAKIHAKEVLDKL